MKRFLISSLLFITICAQAQQIKIASLGTKTLYTPLQSNYSNVPAGYKAVYMNFIGRHGARHLTKDVKVSFAYRLLKRADSLTMLNDSGLALYEMVKNLDKVEEKSFASISISGADELRGIAKRMYKNEKSIFSGVVPILVATTKKGRTQESAEAFLDGLKTEDATLLKEVKFNYADDDHLRFYDFSKTYDDFKDNGNWKIAYNKLADQFKLKDITNRFSRQFFLAGFKLNEKEKLDFTEDIYGFYTILDAIKAELKQAKFSYEDVNFKKYFNLSELYALGLLGDAEDFLKKGPGMNNLGIQVKIASPLLANFINSTDRFLKSGAIKADLRFAHAETIAPFAAIMDIKAASETSKNILNFNQNWKADKVIPFSANIQWVLYQNPKTKKHLVKFMLNEKEVAINGLATKSFPFYSWDAVRAFYLKKLQKLNFNLTGDAHEYLLNVK